MRSPTSAIRRHQVEQLDLLHGTRQTPTWRNLPVEVRERTVPLFASLLREHWSRHPGGAAREVDDE
jgi:hypothetical protein